MLNNFEFILRGDYEKVDASPENSFNLLKDFMANSLSVLPNTFQQINPKVGNKIYNRMAFVDNSDDDLLIEIGMDHIKIATTVDKHMSSEDISRYLERVSTIVGIFDASEIEFGQARRISLIFNQVHDVVPMESEKIYNYFNKADVSNEDIIEWKNRVVKRSKKDISNNNEIINIVRELGRVQGISTIKGENSEFDGIQTLIDINTLDENSDKRIDLNFVKSFIEFAFNVYKAEFLKIEGVISGAKN